jgi:hypothetical protein
MMVFVIEKTMQYVKDCIRESILEDAELVLAILDEVSIYLLPFGSISG